MPSSQSLKFRIEVVFPLPDSPIMSTGIPMNITPLSLTDIVPQRRLTGQVSTHLLSGNCISYNFPHTLKRANTNGKQRHR